MLTAEQLDLIRQADDDLGAVVIGQIRAAMRAAAPTGDAQDFVDLLMERVPEIVDQLGGVAALLGVRAYDLARESSGIRVPFDPEPSGSAPRDQVQSGLRASLVPLWRRMNAAEPVDLDAVYREVVSGVQADADRLVRQPRRDTIADNTVRDPVEVRFARIPRADACGFCQMLASRGAIYLTEDAATARAGRRKGRGKSAYQTGAGSRYHWHCKCVPVPVFDGDELPPVVAAAEQLWLQASDGRSGIDAIREANRLASASR